MRILNDTPNDDFGCAQFCKFNWRHFSSHTLGFIIVFLAAMVILPHQGQGQEPVTVVQTAPSPSPPTKVGKQEQGVFDWGTLTRIGIDSFVQQERAASPPGAMQVKDDYILGPGDQLGLYLLGESQKEFSLSVNPEGKVFVPSVGVLNLGGKSLGEAKRYLGEQMRRYYSEREIEVLLLQPKTVLVAITGAVKQPGRYTLSGLQTVFDALQSAGGPANRGSLRRIRVIHADSSEERVDLYDLLLHGSGSGGPFLRPGDNIFVPPVAESVAIAGEIKRPGIYELDPKTPETLEELISLAAGPSPVAYLERIELSRRLPDGTRRIQYLNGHDSKQLQLRLADGDRIRIYSVLDLQPTQYVEIFGEVHRPGRYELEAGMRIRDLLQKAGGVTREAYLEQAELDRISPKQPVRRVHFSLKEILIDSTSNQNLLLNEFDRVLIRKIPEWYVGPSIEIRGEVLFPGRYTITKDSTRLSEILRLAGGVTKDAFLKGAKLIRPSTRINHDPEFERLKAMRRDEMSDLEYEYFVMKQNREVGIVVVDFEKLWIEHDDSQDIILKDGDIIEIPRAPQVVEVTGRVANPGGVLYKEGASVTYYLEKAGGTTWDARKTRIKVIKSTGEILDDEDVRQIEAGDTIWVPRKPDRNWWQIFRDAMLVLGQLATIYIVIDRATNN